MPFVLDFDSEACSDYVWRKITLYISVSLVSESDSIKAIPSTGSIHRHPTPILETL